MTNAVTQIPAADPQMVREYYERRLALETDCWDVNDALVREVQDFVLLDVRGPALYARGHIPGAVNLPHGKMTAHKMSEWAEDTLFVVYCAGPHCNGTDRAALRLASIGRKVKVMIGGITGWADEGFAFATGSEPGSLTVERERVA